MSRDVWILKAKISEFQSLFQAFYPEYGQSNAPFLLLTLSPPECLMEFCKVTLTFKSADDSYDVTMQMKSLYLYLHMVLYSYLLLKIWSKFAFG